MVENIKQMRARHEGEISQLQKLCSHKKSTRMPFMWAPGHFGNDVEVCDCCGKILKTYGDVRPLPIEEPPLSNKQLGKAIGKTLEGKSLNPIVQESE